MFSYFPKANPNLDHTGFYLFIFILSTIYLVYLWDYINDNYYKPNKKIPIIITIFYIILGGLAYLVSFSEWDIPDNKEYTAKFIRFVPEQEKHTGIKGQVSYTNRIYCEYELTINNQRILMDCNSKQSPEYIKLYWNKY